jgi:RHS repeat-associated protein
MSEATSTVRDLISRPISRTYPDGTTERIEWEGRRVKSVTDRQNRKQSFVYDTKGQLTEVRDGDGALVDLLTYDNAGRLVSWKNAEAEITWADFDFEGRPKRTTQRRFKDASGLATPPVVLDQFSQEHRWNEHGERVLFSMPIATSLGRGWTKSVNQSYDAAGNVTSIARIDGDSSTTLMTATHRGAGRPDVRTVITAGAPIVRTYSYDAASSLLAKVDVSVDGATIAGSEVTYDGQQISQSRLLGISSGERSARYSYDPRSRLAASIYGTRSAADPTVPVAGRAREHVNPADFRTAQERTPVLDPATPGASNVDPPTSIFEEQPGHKIAKATRGPAILPFRYDGAERIDDGRFVYTFDAKGRLIRATEKGSVLATRRVVYSYGGTGRLVGRRAEYSTAPDEWKLEDRAQILAADGLPAETTFAWDPISDRILAVYHAGATGDPLKQFLHSDAAYDDPIETTTTDPLTGAITRLYPIYDEAGAGSLQAVLNASGEVVARNLTNDPYGANDVALTGAAIDRVSITATKNADNKLASVVVTLHVTEQLDPATVVAGSRLAVVDETGSVIRTAPTAATLADPFTITWTLDGSAWQALIESAPSTASLSIAATTALRASAWSSSLPIMPAPDWATATNRVHTSPDLPVEVRDSLSSLSPHLASIPAGESRTTTSYEAPTLPLLGVSTADTALDDIVSARMHAHPFTEPMTALNYVRARWYDPATGTFLSPDPQGYVDSSNLYAFAGGDPVNGRDPRGEQARSDLADDRREIERRNRERREVELRKARRGPGSIHAVEGNATEGAFWYVFDQGTFGFFTIPGGSIDFLQEDAPTEASAGLRKFRQTYAQEIFGIELAASFTPKGVAAKVIGLAGAVLSFSNNLPDDPATITLRYQEGWDKREFSRKARALQDLAERGKLYKAENPVERAELGRAYKQRLIAAAWDKFGKTDREKFNWLRAKILAMQVDHQHDLQLLGVDAETNLWLLEGKVNEGLGQQVWQQIKKLKTKTPIAKVIIEGLD